MHSSIKELLKYLTLIFFGLTCSDLSSSSSLPPAAEMGTCNSKEIIQCSLTNGMIIELILPPDYNDSTSYPIMLFNDGETVFSGSGLNAKFTIDKLIKEKSIKPIITVAVYASGKRNNLYIPYDDDWITRNWGAYKPQAEQYYSEIINVLIPFIDERFSIDKNEIGIGGVSLGGLVSTWMGLKYPEKIKYSASLSGSFWVDDYRIFNEVRELGYNFGNKFWFDIGATTGEWNYYVPLYSKLDSVGVTPGEQSFYFEEKDAEHIFPDWRKRLELPLKIFFGTTDLEAEKMNVVLECIDSSSTLGLRFRRMNPIITLSNKAKFSLAHAATYKLLSGNGLLGSEGSFANDSGDELKVLIEYKEFSEQVTIPSGFCQ